jgi:uncharacterized protein with NRDE domain
MCTLIALHRCVDGAPLVLAANRDEYFERPAEGPALRETPFGSIAAPRDARAGGTWLGLNAAGVFAAVTNRRCEEPDPERRSRGMLVIDALREGRARDAAKRFESLRPDAYNPFNLFLADGETAHVFSYVGKPERIDLGPGPYVIGNVHPGDRTSPKIARLRREAARAADAPAERVLDVLGDACRSHAGADELGATCVHAGPYGTRSSTLLRLDGAGQDGELRYADGAPCTREYEDFTTLLCGLGLLAGTGAGGSIARNVS